MNRRTILKLFKEKKKLHLLLIASLIGVIAVPVFHIMDYINENIALLLFIPFFIGMFVCVHYIHEQPIRMYLDEIRKKIDNILKK